LFAALIVHEPLPLVNYAFYFSFHIFTFDFLLLFDSLVGSLNKIPISLAGLVLFKVPLSEPNFFSILFGNNIINFPYPDYFSVLLFLGSYQ
jgi:hypothetical protein